tara:strand:- start:18290 stop:19408 length:1119 start_codon:yes stop_codon:yes gene_type:complete
MNKDLKYYLPYGDQLRSILVRQDVTSGMLKSILKKRGQFLPKYEKQDIIPVLLRTLLSNDEFEDILEQLKEKESTTKRRTNIIPWSGTQNLLDKTPIKIDIQKLIEEKFRYKPEFSLLNQTNFTQVDGRSDKVEMSFNIQETSHYQSVESRKTTYEGKVTLELKKDGQLYLSTTKNFTSKATQRIVDGIAQKLKTEFKASGVIKKEDDYEKILFEHFTNRNRSYFFMRFFDSIGPLEAKRISNADLAPDKNFNLPVDIDKFLSELETLKLSGKSLHRNPLLSEEVYKDSIVISSISILYNFNHAEGQGTCEVEFSFPDFSSDSIKNVEFQFYIKRLSFNRAYRPYGKKPKVNQAVYDSIQEHMLYHYKQLKN